MKRSSRRRMVAAVSAGLAASLAIAGCSSSGTDNGSDPGSSTGASNSGDANSSGDASLIVAETTGPSTLDPQGSSLFADRYAWQLSYECLMKTTAEGEVEPALATDYTSSDDGLTYTFTLRDGVTFSNGDAFDADDVVYTFDRLKKSPGHIDKELFPTWDSVKKIDDSTVEFTLNSPDAGFVYNMGNPLVWGCAIMDVDATDGLQTQMVGTGPWVQTGFQPDTSLTLQRNDEYWGDKTKAAGLKVLYMPTMATQVSNLKAGKVDIIFPDQGSAQGLGDDFNVDTVHTDSTIFMQIDNVKPPLDNPKVAQAVALAIDRQALADGAYGGAAQPSGYLPPGIAWAPDASDLPNYTQDVDKAKQLLKDAGFDKPVPLELSYITDYDPGTNDLMALLQAQLNAAGFDITLNPLEAAAWSKYRVAPKYDLSWNKQSGYPDPYQYIAPVEGRQGETPDSLQTMIDDAMAATSVEDYQKALVKVEQEEAKTVFPTITLLAVDGFVAYPDSISGVKVPSNESRGFLVNVTKS